MRSGLCLCQWPLQGVSVVEPRAQSAIPIYEDGDDDDDDDGDEDDEPV